MEAFVPNAWRLAERSGGDASDTDGKLEERALRAQASQTPYNPLFLHELPNTLPIRAGRMSA